MAKERLSEELWAVNEPLMPPPPPRPTGGRTRVPNRALLIGILFVLKSGIPWEFLVLRSRLPIAYYISQLTRISQFTQVSIPGPPSHLSVPGPPSR